MREHYVGEKHLEPSRYIILDVEPHVGLARAKGRGGVLTHFDNRKIDFHAMVRQGFLDFAKMVNGTVVDAGQPVEIVKKQVFELC